MAELGAARDALRHTVSTLLYASVQAEHGRLVLPEQVDALQLIGQVRHDLDPLELQLLELVKDEGLTWSQISTLYDGRNRAWMALRYRSLGGTKRYLPGRQRKR